MMRRIFLLLTVFCFVLLPASSAFADYYPWSSSIREYCSVDRMICSFTCMDTFEQLISCSYHSESSHKIVVSRRYECVYCLARGYAPESITQQQTVYEDHIVTYRTDGGHIDGTLLHRRLQECSKCGPFTVTLACEGPPCYIFWSLPH